VAAAAFRAQQAPHTMTAELTVGKLNNMPCDRHVWVRSGQETAPYSHPILVGWCTCPSIMKLPLR